MTKKVLFDGFDDNQSTNNWQYLFPNQDYNTQWQGITNGTFRGFAITSSRSGNLWYPWDSSNYLNLGIRVKMWGYGCSGIILLDNKLNVMFRAALNSALNGTAQCSNSTGLWGGNGDGPSVGGNTLGTSGIVGPTNINRYFEFECIVNADSIAGSVELYVNNKNVLSLSSINTVGTVTTTGSVAYVGFCFGGNQGGNHVVDDFYCEDYVSPYNGPLSNVYGVMGPTSYLFTPSTDAQKQWNPSSGTVDAAMVADTNFDGDNSYVYASTPGAQDIYNLATISNATLTKIESVDLYSFARVDDAGTRIITSSIENNGTIVQGATQVMVADYVKHKDSYVLDPTTSAAWNPSAFNGGTVKIGVNLVE